ncbi:MAG: hypothetical protein AB4080_13155 [Trichodesmium sp.]
MANKFLIDHEAIELFCQSINWEAESDRLSNSTLVYLEDYTYSNCYGIKEGYLIPFQFRYVTYSNPILFVVKILLLFREQGTLKCEKLKFSGFLFTF